MTWLWKWEGGGTAPTSSLCLKSYSEENATNAMDEEANKHDATERDNDQESSSSKSKTEL